MALLLNSLSASAALLPGGKMVAQTMPGVTAPFGFFDPAGLVPESKEELLLFREAELAHGRVAMVASVGFLVQEKFHPLFADIDGPSIRQLDLVLQTYNGQSAGVLMLAAVFFSEIARARIGWKDPDDEIRTLREEYLPGDLGFDPLGMKPKDAAGLLSMQNKELNNGRLAMLAAAGIVAQELVSEQTLF